MQIKTTMRYHLTPARMLSSKNSQTINAGEEGERRKPSFTIGRNVYGTITMENSMEILKN